MGNAAIFAGQFVKLLKDKLLFGSTARIVTGTDTPQSTATDGEAGSIYMRVGSNPGLFQKQDAGVTTNWRTFDPIDDMQLYGISAGNLLVRGGGMVLPDGRFLLTWDGAGSLSTDFHTPLSVSMATLVPAPVNGTTYGIYIDLDTISSSPTVLTDTGVEVYPVTAAKIVALTTQPETTDLNRFIPLGVVLRSGGAWTYVESAHANREPTPLVAISPKVFSMPFTALGAVGTVGQIAGGHVITASSLPVPVSLTNQSWWSLAANLNNGDTNIRPLTVGGGGATFPAGGLMGAPDTSIATCYLYRDESGFFATNVDFTAAVWSKSATDAQCTSVGIMGIGLNATRSWELAWGAIAGILELKFCVTGGSQTAYERTVQIDLRASKNAWHHFAVTKTSTYIRLYIDGVLAVAEAESVYAQTTNARFYLGSSPSLAAGAAQFPTMREAIFYSTAAMTVDEVKKLAAFKVTHNGNVPGTDQWWMATWAKTATGANAEPLQNDWLVDKSDPLNVYVLFRGGVASTDYLSIQLLDTGMTSLRVATPRTFDSGWLAAAPAFPLPHNLPDVPTDVSLLYESSPGVFTLLPADVYLTWDATNFTGSFAALSGLGLGPTKRIKVFASIGSRPGAIMAADINHSGLVSTTDQHLSGNKWLQGNLLPETDSAYDFGSSLLRWRAVYSDLVDSKSSNAASTGAELITAAVDRDMSGANGWSGTNWSVTGVVLLHTAGATTATLAGYPATIGAVYQITMTIATSTVGALTINYGGASSRPVGQSSGTLTSYTVVLIATSTAGLSLTPDASWAGSIDDVSVKQITPSAASLSLRNASGVVGLEGRTVAATCMGLGVDALMCNAAGPANTAVGYRALRATTSGGGNTAVGFESLLTNTTGPSNTAVGYQALRYNTAGGNNTALGDRALTANTTGGNNTAVGRYSLYTNLTGSENVAVGLEALYLNTTGSSNLASGYGSLRSNTTGSNNVALGVYALYDNTTGLYNTAVGSLSMEHSATGSNNTAVGYQALNVNGGNDNTAVGYQALLSHGAALGNTAVGYQALRASNANGNTSVGYQSLLANTSGQYNTAVGYQALFTNTTTGGNVAIGWQALYANTAVDNVAVGYQALAANTTGTNTAVGRNALQSNTTGSSNTAVGYSALQGSTTGQYNTAIGHQALSGTNFDNTTGLGYGATVNGSNQVQLGDSATTTYAYGAVQNRSDARDKADIRDTVLGLDFIEKLRPVDYRWDYREDYRPDPPASPPPSAPEEVQAAYRASLRAWVSSTKLEYLARDGSKKRTRFHHGLIAQEVKEIIDSTGIDFGGFQDCSLQGGEAIQSLGYAELIGPMIKAIQQLKGIVDAQAERIAALEG